MHGERRSPSCFCPAIRPVGTGEVALRRSLYLAGHLEMVTKNRPAASRGRTPQAHVRSGTRLLASKVAADMSTADVLRPPRQFRRGRRQKKERPRWARSARKQTGSALPLLMCGNKKIHVTWRGAVSTKARYQARADCRSRARGHCRNTRPRARRNGENVAHVCQHAAHL